MLPGDRLVCAFVESQAVGNTFVQWPLHVTIVPWFRLDMNSEEVAEKLYITLKGTEPFEVMMGEEAHFGHRGSKLVNLIQTPSPFQVIEPKIRAFLKQQNAWLVDETTKRRQQFRPHVTAQGDKRLHTGDTFKINKLYIVEQKGDYKKVTAEIYFGETAA